MRISMSSKLTGRPGQCIPAEFAAAASESGTASALLEAIVDELLDAHTHLTANYRDSWRLVCVRYLGANPMPGGYAVTAVRLAELEARKAGVARQQRAALWMESGVSDYDRRAQTAHFLRFPRYCG